MLGYLLNSIKIKIKLKELGLNPRALGTNPKALGINPRALAAKHITHTPRTIQEIRDSIPS